MPKRKRGENNKLDIIEFWPEESIPYEPAMGIEDPEIFDDTTEEVT
jgi:hypothetical protein